MKSKKYYIFEFMKSWGRKRILTASAVMVIIISVIVLLYAMLYFSSKNSIIDRGRITAVQSAEQFDRYLSVGINAVELVGYDLDDMIKTGNSKDMMLEYLKKESTVVKKAILETVTGFYAYVVDNDERNGKYLDGTGWVPSANYKPWERPWYAAAKEKNGELAVTDPYVDAQTGSVVVTLAKQLSDKKSILAVDILMDEIQNMTEKLAEDNNGTIECVLDSTGNVLSHSDREQLGKCYTKEKDTMYGKMAGILYCDNNYAEKSGYFEMDWEGKSYIIYTVPVQDKWVSVSVIDSSEEFVSLNMILLVMIAFLIIAVVIMLFTFSRSAKKDSIAAKLNAQLSSSADIYLAVYDIDMINNSLSDIKSGMKPETEYSFAADSMSMQEKLNASAIYFTEEDYRDEVLKFIDLSTLEKRMHNLKTITIEYKSDKGTWRRGRWIVSERTKDGHLFHVLWVMEDIDKERKNRDKIYDKAQQLALQLRSVANVYRSVHDIDIINNTFSEIVINDLDVSIDIDKSVTNAQEVLRDVMSKRTDSSSLDEIMKFIEFSNIKENVSATGSATIEFLNSRGMWSRGRFIVSERTADGEISHVIWAVENIDKEKRDRDMISEKARQLTAQLKSAVNIYTSAHDVDIINDTFTVIHTSDKMIADVVGDKNIHAQSTISTIMEQMTDVMNRKEMLEFVDLSTLDQRISGKDTLTIEYRNSRQRWRRGRFIVSERTEDGKLSHVLWTVEDIHDEKKIRDGLYDIANKLNTQLASMGDIYSSVLDINIIEDTYNEMKSTTKDINEMSLEYEDDAQLYIFKQADRFADSSSVEQLHNFLNLSTLSKRMQNNNTITIEFLESDKLWFRGRFIASQWTPSGKLSHVLWTVENINDEKTERDKLLDISEKAMAANAAKSTFLSNMSHEIRTPINAVLGMNEMVLRECNDKNILAYSESIKTAGNTLLGLINDILDFSKIESGKMEIIPVDYDMASVLNDLVNMVQTRADNKGLALDLEFDHRIPQYLNGDEIRIKQVITNILTNAVKYTKKGTVTFGITFDKLPDEPEYIVLNVYVKDTGIGIKKEDMDKLFSEFERIDEIKNRNIEGTGLGMNITKSLLSMMGSSLNVESVYGLGSMFSFSLKQKVVKWDPIGDYETSYRSSLSAKKRYKEKFTAPQAHLLVIDDTPMNLMVFKSLLKQTKVQIDIANSGDEGISAALENKYDIIFLDHMMPKKDGIQTLKEMKAEPNNPNLDTITICLTANAISGAREQYIAEGFDDYITKPIDPTRLEELLMNYLPKHKVVYTSNDSSDREGIADESVIPPYIYDIPEIDIEKGIQNCGDAVSYAETLHTYADTINAYIEEIQEHYDSRKIQDATIKIHALKSTSRIIGAVELGELAQALENAGNDGNTEFLAENIGGFLDRCRSLSEALSPLREEPEEDDSALPTITDGEYCEACSQLKEYADSCDTTGIMTMIAELKTYKLTDKQKEQIKAVKKAADDFEYEAIIDILE